MNAQSILLRLDALSAHVYKFIFFLIIFFCVKWKMLKKDYIWLYDIRIRYGDTVHIFAENIIFFNIFHFTSSRSHLEIENNMNLHTGRQKGNLSETACAL